MKFSPENLNRFLFFKLPSAFICGVRVREILPERCTVAVKHRWINQNPFKSMYFAVQAMAAELSTAIPVMSQINNSGKSISMLVAATRSTFTKKATGRILFTCTDGTIASDAIQRAIATGEGQTFWMYSIGTNENGEQVSHFELEWTIRVKQRS